MIGLPFGTGHANLCAELMAFRSAPPDGVDMVQEEALVPVASRVTAQERYSMTTDQLVEEGEEGEKGEELGQIHS